MRKILQVTACLALSSSAYAQSPRNTVGALLEDCRQATKVSQLEGVEFQQAAFCTVYVSGVVFGIKFEKFNSASTTNFCLPLEFTKGQLTTVFTRWADSHPNRWHEFDAAGVVTAMVDAFPCKAPQKPSLVPVEGNPFSGVNGIDVKGPDGRLHHFPPDTTKQTIEAVMAERYPQPPKN